MANNSRRAASKVPVVRHGVGHGTTARDVYTVTPHRNITRFDNRQFDLTANLNGQDYPSM